MELSQAELLSLKQAKWDAAKKTAELPDRLKDEFQQASHEQREPFEITPLTCIRANLVVAAIEKITGDVEPGLAEIIGVQRRSCGALGTEKVFLLSEQLLAILTAAGIED